MVFGSTTLLNLMTKTKTYKELLHAYTKKNIHYTEGKVLKKSFYKVRSWPKHPRLDRVRDLVYRFVGILVKGLKKIQERL